MIADILRAREREVEKREEEKERRARARRNEEERARTNMMEEKARMMEERARKTRMEAEAAIKAKEEAAAAETAKGLEMAPVESLDRVSTLASSPISVLSEPSRSRAVSEREGGGNSQSVGYVVLAALLSACAVELLRAQLGVGVEGPSPAAPIPIGGDVAAAPSSSQSPMGVWGLVQFAVLFFLLNRCQRYLRRLRKRQMAGIIGGRPGWPVASRGPSSRNLKGGSYGYSHSVPSSLGGSSLRGGYSSDRAAMGWRKAANL